MRRIATLAVMFVLLVPASAVAAGNSTCQAYNPQLCSSVTTTDGTRAAQTLPFTGLDAVLLVGGGATLLASGLVVRLLSRRLN